MLFPRNGIDRKSPQLVTRTVISCKVKKLAKCSANGTGISTVIASKSALSCEHYRGFFSIGPANFFSISFDSTFFFHFTKRKVSVVSKFAFRHIAIHEAGSLDSNEMFGKPLV